MQLGAQAAPQKAQVLPSSGRTCPLGSKGPRSHAPRGHRCPKLHTPCAPRPFAGIPSPAGMTRASSMGVFLGASARPQPVLLEKRALGFPKPSRFA